MSRRLHGTSRNSVSGISTSTSTSASNRTGSRGGGSGTAAAAAGGGVPDQDWRATLAPIIGRSDNNVAPETAEAVVWFVRVVAQYCPAGPRRVWGATSGGGGSGGGGDAGATSGGVAPGDWPARAVAGFVARHGLRPDRFPPVALHEALLHGYLANDGGGGIAGGNAGDDDQDDDIGAGARAVAAVARTRSEPEPEPQPKPNSLVAGWHLVAAAHEAMVNMAAAQGVVQLLEVQEPVSAAAAAVAAAGGRGSGHGRGGRGTGRGG